MFSTSIINLLLYQHGHSSSLHLTAHGEETQTGICEAQPKKRCTALGTDNLDMAGAAHVMTARARLHTLPPSSGLTVRIFHLSYFRSLFFNTYGTFLAPNMLAVALVMDVFFSSINCTKFVL